MIENIEETNDILNRNIFRPEVDGRAAYSFAIKGIDINTYRGMLPLKGKAINASSGRTEGGFDMAQSTARSRIVNPFQYVMTCPLETPKGSTYTIPVSRQTDKIDQFKYYPQYREEVQDSQEDD